MVTLFFTQESFGAQFFDLEEMKELDSFFKKIETGFTLVGDCTSLEKKMLALKKASVFERLISFLSLLRDINFARYSTLSSYALN